jgi:lipopolysaccharide export system permease protein
MRIVDRYVVALFLRVFLICCTCLTGIYVVGDFVENLNEFIDAGDEHGGLLKVLANYYAGRVPWFLDMIGRVAALIAGVFAVTWLQRNNEMTALMAAGISRWRIIKPIVIGVIVVSVLSAVNRELIIPRFREDLSQSIGDWSGNRATPLSPQFDYMTDILIDGQRVVAREKKIIKPMFRLPATMSHFGYQLTAEQATRLTETVDHPTGYLLEDVALPEGVGELDAVLLDGRPVIYTPKMAPWLKPNQCFVASYVTFGQLLGGRSWRQFASTADLIAGLKNPSMNFGADVRVSVHSRLLQPLLDVTLFFLGIPVVLARESRNVFVSAGSCVMIVALYFITVLSSHGLGMNYLISPAFAAWCPVFIMVPLAILRSSPLRR